VAPRISSHLKRFFGHFLKGEDTGWDRQPPVHLNVRHVDGSFELRAEQEGPLALTVQGRDFEFPGEGPWPTTYGVQMKGHGMFLHDNPDDRPAAVFGGTTTLVSSPRGAGTAAIASHRVEIPRQARLTASSGRQDGSRRPRQWRRECRSHP
jgi:hypothetical protein